MDPGLRLGDLLGSKWSSVDSHSTCGRPGSSRPSPGCSNGSADQADPKDL